MEITYTLNANDFLWLTARGWLDARPLLKRRILVGVLAFVLAPLAFALVFPGLAHAIEAFWAIDIIVFIALIVLIATLVQRFAGPLLSMGADLQTKTISIGPDCVVEQNVDVVAIPWEYVKSVRQDPLFVQIAIDNGDLYTIPRRAFANVAASLKFGILAGLWWRKGHRRANVVRQTPPRQIL
jgi:hypothetical protein